MTARMSQPLIPADKIDSMLQLEPILMTLGLIFTALVIYKVFLRGVSEERHRNLTHLFKNLSMHVLFGTLTFVGYYAMNRLNADGSDTLVRVASYVGLVTIISWTTVFVKTCRILIFEYLFLSHMRVGVPLLLVNLFTLLITVVLGCWLLTEVFDVKLAPLLATSAIFSIVLGLALQDTLGNLFAGIAMAFDKPYEIGDWIEVTVNDIKWVGQVQEMSWRATVLVAIGNESISVPNRMMGQTQISNFSSKTRPVCRSQLFRVAHGSSIPEVKRVLGEAALQVKSILKYPAPFTYVWESNESFMTFKIVYFINDFGRHLLIGDEVITAGNEALQKAGFDLAPARILVMHGDSNKSEKYDEAMDSVSRIRTKV
jgi:small-conductance mechanosensitive channel